MSSIGFTGTQRGMTLAQMQALYGVLVSGMTLKERQVTEFHHGDCIGSDKEASTIATALYFVIIGHPPLNSSKRAFCHCKELRKPLPYLERNKAIVDESELLIATPYGSEEELRSGTWSTVRYARKQRKSIVLILPDGSTPDLKGWHFNDY